MQIEIISICHLFVSQFIERERISFSSHPPFQHLILIKISSNKLKLSLVKFPLAHCVCEQIPIQKLFFIISFAPLRRRRLPSVSSTNPSYLSQTNLREIVSPDLSEHFISPIGMAWYLIYIFSRLTSFRRVQYLTN